MIFAESRVTKTKSVEIIQSAGMICCDSEQMDAGLN